jgi:hypothetical protein
MTSLPAFKTKTRLIHTPAKACSRVLAITEELLSLDPASDMAIELVYEALNLGKIKTVTLSNRFNVAASPVIAFWENSLVSYTSVGFAIKHLDDAHSSAKVWLFEQLNEYKHSPGQMVAPFLRTRQPWFKSAYRRSLSSGIFSHGRFAVLGVASAVRESFYHKEHRDPTLQELQKIIYSTLYDQARDKLIASNQNKVSHFNAEEMDEAIQTYLVKEGIKAALDDFATISLDTSPLLYFSSNEDLQEENVNNLVASPVHYDNTDNDDLDPEIAYERLLSVALGDDLWARSLLSAKAGEVSSGADCEGDISTLRAYAQAHSREVSELKALLIAARSRTQAPHAHFAHLSANIPVITTC